MPLVKSHSNYVLKKKHQNVSDGTIWERDIATIGRANFFAPGQQPIFRDNNFIITVRDDGSVANQYNRVGWKESSSGNNSTVWTLQTISAITSEFDDQDDTKIVLKQDYYDFCDFAYYGSLSELFRASITDILLRFPGELYGTTDNDEHTVYYTSGETINGEWIETEYVLGKDASGNTLYEVNNPFGIDIHTKELPVGMNPLKYFADNGYKNYVIVSGDSEYEVNEWNVAEYYSVYDQNIGKYIPYSAITYSNPDRPDEIISGTPTSTYHPCKGEKIAGIDVNHKDGNSAQTIRLDIFAYLGDNDTVYYLSNSCQGVHIRLKEDKYLADFYNGCDNFQKLLMNPKTTPRYKATFSVIKEDDYGYHREMRAFIFPTGPGGYNIDASSYGFNNYTNDLAMIGEFYDERFTDNLWRSMTHEAIKNFDWTYTREYEQGEEEEFVLGGEKMQKALRVFAREFDEIKTYIDNITSVNRITYDDRGNIPNYFLTDVCEDDGWDVIQVIPYDVTLTTGICNANKYVQNTKKEVKPYNSIVKGKNGTNIKNGYFISCCSGDGVSISSLLCEYTGNTNYYVKVADANQGTFYDSCVDKLKNRIRTFTDTADTYTYMDVNNEFLRRLKLNSRYIWRHKGTQEGIEMILAMFGLKSKRWYDKQEVCGYKKKSWDYDITEYTRFSSGLTDPWDDCHSMHKYDWVNSTKTITYDYRTVSAYNSRGTMGITYIPYQGLPVAYVQNYRFTSGSTNLVVDFNDRKIKKELDSGSLVVVCQIREDNSFVIDEVIYYIIPMSIMIKNNEKLEEKYELFYYSRDLYPKFNIDEQYDGNPYFQMNGGWLSKKISNGTTKYGFQFDVDNVPVYETDGDIFKETVRNIRRVETLNDLLAIPAAQVKTNSICYVEDLNKEMLIVDGEAFDVNIDTSRNKFIILRRVNGMIKVGDKYFNTNITVYGKDGKLYTYNLEDKLDGYPVNAYIVNGGFHCSNGNYSIDLYRLFSPSDSATESNYFILNDESFSNTIAISSNQKGWERLSKNSYIYKKINTIWNYFKGNNPHSGNMNYDNGEYYYEYFKHIFKHAYENDLFDERCYNDYYNEIDDIYTAATISVDSGDTADKKIHYFGNWYSGTTKYIYCNSSYKFIPSGNPYETKLKSDSITNQIINNKRLTIKFKIGYGYNTTNGQAKLKFIDEIVMNYLTQLIPSTTIVGVEYEFR